MYYNCHIHLFTDRDVPNGFLPFGLVPIMRSTAGYKVISKILKNLIFWTDNDILDRYNKFVTTGRLGSQQKILEKCLPFYPEGTRFIILPMDMAFMGAGKVPRPYPDQLAELFQVSLIYPQIIPFVHVDPRRKNILELVKKCVEQWNYKGIKLYPPLGTFPYDEGFWPIYEYAQSMNLPVLTHCSPYNPVHFKGSRKELLQLLGKAKQPIDTQGKKIKELCANFTHPMNFVEVIKQFPSLRICFGHFGSQYFWDQFIHHPSNPDNWLRIIRDLCIQYPNFYTDISFTMSETKYFSLLKVLLTDDKLSKKILFGSDFYMVEVESDERRFGIDLRAFIGEANFDMIAVKNPHHFLFGEM